MPDAGLKSDHKLPKRLTWEFVWTWNTKWNTVFFQLNLYAWPASNKRRVWNKPRV